MTGKRGERSPPRRVCFNICHRHHTDHVLVLEDALPDKIVEFLNCMETVDSNVFLSSDCSQIDEIENRLAEDGVSHTPTHEGGINVLQAEFYKLLKLGELYRMQNINTNPTAYDAIYSWMYVHYRPVESPPPSPPPPSPPPPSPPLPSPPPSPTAHPTE